MLTTLQEEHLRSLIGSSDFDHEHTHDVELLLAELDETRAREETLKKQLLDIRDAISPSSISVEHSIRQVMELRARNAELEAQKLTQFHQDVMGSTSFLEARNTELEELIIGRGVDHGDWLEFLENEIEAAGFKMGDNHAWMIKSQLDYMGELITALSDAISPDAHSPQHAINLAREMREALELSKKNLAEKQHDIDYQDHELEVLRNTPDGEALDHMQALASYVGANGSWDPKSAKQLDERIRWGIDHNIDVWKNAHDRLNTKINEVVIFCSQNGSQVSYGNDDSFFVLGYKSALRDVKQMLSTDAQKLS